MAQRVEEVLTCLNGDSAACLLIEVQALAEPVAHGEGRCMQNSHWQGQTETLFPATPSSTVSGVQQLS